jgi:hypothetical protein
MSSGLDSWRSILRKDKGSLIYSVHTDSETHTASYLMGNRRFSLGDKATGA